MALYGVPAPMEKTFTIEINLCETFTVAEIWPDGNAPENPTADDVRALLLKDPYDVHHTCKDWGLEVRKEDVYVTMHDPEELQPCPRGPRPTPH